MGSLLLLLRLGHLVLTRNASIIGKQRFGISTFDSRFYSNSPTLTDEELTKINNLIPHLCNSNQLPTALRLTTTALLTNPTLDSLNLTPLIHSLTSHSDLTHTMSLLTHLLHTAQSHSYIPPISLMLISSYLQIPSSNHALKLLRWLQRPTSPSPPDATMYRLVITGLCRDGLLLHAVNAFRDMVAASDIVLCSDSMQCLYRGFLREARVAQGLELNAALSNLARDPQERENVLHVLDSIIADWTE